MAENQDQSTQHNEKLDDELDALLDSALEDFDKLSVKESDKNAPGGLVANESTSNPPGASGLDLEALSKTFDDPLQAKLMSEFEKTFRSLVSEDDDLPDDFTENLKKLTTETMNTIRKESDVPDKEFEETIASTLQNLTANTASLKEHFANSDLAGLFAGLESGDIPSDLSSIFNNIMQLFLSKDMLYPSLKDLLAKYPPWLEENKSSLSEENYNKYQQQYNIIEKVCQKMEESSPTDSEDVKMQRFQSILELMQQMQDYGEPPKALIGDAMSFDMSNWL